MLKAENYVGRAPQQTIEFVDGVVKPLLDKNSQVLGLKSELNV